MLIGSRKSLNNIQINFEITLGDTEVSKANLKNLGDCGCWSASLEKSCTTL